MISVIHYFLINFLQVDVFLYSPYISLSLVAFQNRLWEKFGKHPRRVGLRHARSRVAPPCGVGGRPVHCYYFFVGQWSSVWHYMIIAMPRRTWIDNYCKKGRWCPAVNFLWRTKIKELNQISLLKSTHCSNWCAKWGQSSKIELTDWVKITGTVS